MSSDIRFLKLLGKAHSFSRLERRLVPVSAGRNDHNSTHPGPDRLGSSLIALFGFDKVVVSRTTSFAFNSPRYKSKNSPLRMFQPNKLYALISARSGREGPLGSSLHPRRRILTREPDQTEAGAVAHLRVGLVGENAFK